MGHRPISRSKASTRQRNGRLSSKHAGLASPGTWPGPKYVISESKFIASFKIENRKYRSWRSATMESRVYPLSSFGTRTIFGPPSSGGTPGVPPEAQWPEKFAAIVANVPAKELPAPEVVEFFTNPKLNKKQFDQIDTPEVMLFVGGDTAEEAEERVIGLLTLLDWGVSRPLQLEIWQRRRRIYREAASGSPGAARCQGETRAACRRARKLERAADREAR